MSVEASAVPLRPSPASGVGFEVPETRIEVRSLEDPNQCPQGVVAAHSGCMKAIEVIPYEAKYWSAAHLLVALVCSPRISH